MDRSLLDYAVKCHGRELYRLIKQEHGTSFPANAAVGFLPEAESNVAGATSGGSNTSIASISPHSSPLIRKSYKDTSTGGNFTTKLHDFIARKADLLFQKKPKDAAVSQSKLPSAKDAEKSDYYAIIPPLEQFMGIGLEACQARAFQLLGVGDVVAGRILSTKEFGIFVILLAMCRDGSERFLEDCEVVALLPAAELRDKFSHVTSVDDFQIGDLVRAVVIKVEAVQQKVIISLHARDDRKEVEALGLISESDLPVYYRRSLVQIDNLATYEEMLENSVGFDNPFNVSYLGEMLGVNDGSPMSLMRGLQRGQFPEKEFAETLRKWQTNRWSMESVAKGVEFFKAGNFLDAMHHLNKALEIDEENVEALVARGALHANRDLISKALNDFSKALQLNPNHRNANKYMCQTLIEKGKQLEDVGKIDKATECYQTALDINPEFLEAQLCLNMISKPKRAASPASLSTNSPTSLSETHISTEALRKMVQPENLHSQAKSSTQKKKKKKTQKDHDRSFKKFKDEKCDMKSKRRQRSSSRHYSSDSLKSSYSALSSKATNWQKTHSFSSSKVKGGTYSGLDSYTSDSSSSRSIKQVSSSRKTTKRQSLESKELKLSRRSNSSCEEQVPTVGKQRKLQSRNDNRMLRGKIERKSLDPSSKRKKLVEDSRYGGEKILSALPETSARKKCREYHKDPGRSHPADSEVHTAKRKKTKNGKTSSDTYLAKSSSEKVGMQEDQSTKKKRKDRQTLSYSRSKSRSYSSSGGYSDESYSSISGSRSYSYTSYSSSSYSSSSYSDNSEDSHFQKQSRKKSRCTSIENTKRRHAKKHGSRNVEKQSRHSSKRKVNDDSGSDVDTDMYEISRDHIEMYLDSKSYRKTDDASTTLPNKNKQLPKDEPGPKHKGDRSNKKGELLSKGKQEFSHGESGKKVTPVLYSAAHDERRKDPRSKCSSDATQECKISQAIPVHVRPAVQKKENYGSGKACTKSTDPNTPHSPVLKKEIIQPTVPKLINVSEKFESVEQTPPSFKINLDAGPHRPVGTKSQQPEIFTPEQVAVIHSISKHFRQIPPRVSQSNDIMHPGQSGVHRYSPGNLTDIETIEDKRLSLNIVNREHQIGVIVTRQENCDMQQGQSEQATCEQLTGDSRQLDSHRHSKIPIEVSKLVPETFDYKHGQHKKSKTESANWQAPRHDQGRGSIASHGLDQSNSGQARIHDKTSGHNSGVRGSSKTHDLNRSNLWTAQPDRESLDHHHRHVSHHGSRGQRLHTDYPATLRDGNTRMEASCDSRHDRNQSTVIDYQHGHGSKRDRRTSPDGDVSGHRKTTYHDSHHERGDYNRAPSDRLGSQYREMCYSSDKHSFNRRSGAMHHRSSDRTTFQSKESNPFSELVTSSKETQVASLYCEGKWGYNHDPGAIVMQTSKRLWWL